MPPDPFDLFPLGGIAGDDSSGERAGVERLQLELRRAHERTDRLALVCQALWELLRERAGLSENDLVQRIREIDLRDGVADGRITPVPVVCPACHRQSTSRREECLYCGTRLPGGSLLERL